MLLLGIIMPDFSTLALNVFDEEVIRGTLSPSNYLVLDWIQDFINAAQEEYTQKANKVISGRQWGNRNIFDAGYAKELAGYCNQLHFIVAHFLEEKGLMEERYFTPLREAFAKGHSNQRFDAAFILQGIIASVLHDKDVQQGLPGLNVKTDVQFSERLCEAARNLCSVIKSNKVDIWLTTRAVYLLEKYNEQYKYTGTNPILQRKLGPSVLGPVSAVPTPYSNNGTDYKEEDVDIAGTQSLDLGILTIHREGNKPLTIKPGETGYNHIARGIRTYEKNYPPAITLGSNSVDILFWQEDKLIATITLNEASPTYRWLQQEVLPTQKEANVRALDAPNFRPGNKIEVCFWEGGEVQDNTAILSSTPAYLGVYEACRDTLKKKARFL